MDISSWSIFLHLFWTLIDFFKMNLSIFCSFLSIHACKYTTIYVSINYFSPVTHLFKANVVIIRARSQYIFNRNLALYSFSYHITHDLIWIKRKITNKHDVHLINWKNSKFSLLKLVNKAINYDSVAEFK